MIGFRSSIASGAIGTINTDADVETYIIGDATGNTIFVGINSATQVIFATAATDDVTFFLQGVTSFTGTITGQGTTNDELFLFAGDSVVGATINNVEDLFLNGTGTYSIDLADWNNFTGTVTAAGTNTVNLAGSGTTAAEAVVENYVLNGTGVNVFSFDEVTDATLTDAVRGGMSINLAAGTSTVNIDNAAIDAAVDSSIDILSFLSGTDKLDIDVNNVSHNAGYQTITAAGTNITVAANSVIEIQSTVGTAIDLTQVGNAGGVETLIASAIADANTALNNGDDLTFIIYSGANAGIYNVDVTTASADMVAADITVELVAIVNGVGTDALTSGDFI